MVGRTEMEEESRGCAPKNEIVGVANEFDPSRGRVVTSTALAGAAQEQAAGRALPPLILCDWRDVSDHVRVALHVNPICQPDQYRFITWNP